MSDSRTSPRAGNGNGKRRRRQGQHVEVEERQQIMETFLTAFRANGNTYVAARQAGISRSTAYRWAAENLDGFADAWVEAELDVNDVVDAEMWRRGILGEDKPITVAGKREVIREKSMEALKMIAQARMPWKYRQNYEGDGPPLTGPRAGASASASAQATVYNFTINGQVKRLEEMTPAELEAAAETLDGELGEASE